MPFSIHFRNTIRHYFAKKHSSIIQHFSTCRCQRKRKLNIVQKINSSDKSHSTSKLFNNYDMTILHDDELNNTQLVTLRRRKKKIPYWATKDQLQLAVINQTYFQDQNPEDIFGSICMDQVLHIINSMNISHHFL